MKSPFPGMDPYLQQRWRDVHTSLVIYARDQLQNGLPGDLVARAEDRVYLEREGELDRSFYPDVHVVEQRPSSFATTTVGEVELAEPFIVTFRDEPITEPFIQIVDAKTGKRVVTFIEFISPTNKVPGEGNDLYRQKQKEAEMAGVSLVEIDLILGGKRALSVPLSRVRFRDRTRYQAVARRGWQGNLAEVYALPLHKRLPVISIPLRETDPDARLDLQALIDQCYRNGRYASIDYQEPPDPPLEGHDAEWADALLRTAGKRK